MPGKQRRLPPRRSHSAPPEAERPTRPGLFTRLASGAARAVGTPWAFLIAAGLIVIWSVTGPVFGFSDTWQLVINTTTTIVTFLMVFLIQNTQNRDARALHLKVDELIRAVGGARNSLIDLEEMSDEELQRVADQFRKLQSRRTRSKATAVELASRSRH